MIQAFIFDMDGVIIDSEPLHFEIDILTMRRFGAEISKERLERFVGMTNPEMWAAKAAGMKCIGYVNENSGRQDLSAADEIVRSIRDIRAEEL